MRQVIFHFQPNINVGKKVINVDDQRCFRTDLMLIFLVGKFLLGHLVLVKLQA